MYYIQLDPQNVVVSVTESSQNVEADNVIETPMPRYEWLGHTYDRATGTATPPPAPAPVTKMTRKAFLSRFTDDEAIDIDLASMGATREAAGLRRYLAKVNAADHIDMHDEELRTGVLVLELAGLIGAGRAAEILDTPLNPKEYA